MGVTAQIKGKQNFWAITPDNLGEVVVHPRPPVNSQITPLPYRDYFRLGGDPAGAFDMRVAGTLADPIDFQIRARTDGDIYIKSISVVIVDQNATLSQFGNIGALTNGIQFAYSNVEEGIVTIDESLQTNWHFVRLAGGEPAFGDAATAFRANSVAGNSEGYTPFIDVARIFGLPWGIKLETGSTDTLTWRIRDDITGVDEFDIVAYGILVRDKSGRTDFS